MKRYDNVTTVKTGNDRYTVTYYEWTEGQGRDCGLNREATDLTRERARELAEWLREQNQGE